MTDKKYLEIIGHYENCFAQYGDTPKGMDWPNEKDAIKRYKVMMDLIPYTELNNSETSLLDFGCGTGLLYKFLLEKEINKINYAGLDLSEKFIQSAQEKFPQTVFYNLDILDQNIKLPTFDYIIANGVFTEKRGLSYEEMLTYFKKMLLAMTPFFKKGLALNVMSKEVDWERWDLFHLSTDVLIKFLTQNISRKFIIRNDYGLYEYTVYIYK